VHLANQIYELVDKYLRRLDQELQKFKIELEADNSGITEILERSESLIYCLNYTRYESMSK
jgi:inhibitor of growth protein 3